jgi:hypothetical protein
MRMISLLITLLIVAYLVYSQLGSSGPAPSQQATYIRAENKAKAVDAQVQDQFEKQNAALSHMENGEAAGSAPAGN